MQAPGLAQPLTDDGLKRAAGMADASLHALWAVVSVETAGCGFLPDRRPRILFEKHVFRDLTSHRFDATHPDISGPSGDYGAAGAYQYVRLESAIACDRTGALKSASWGLGQIMGFNAGAAGFADVELMCAAMADGEDAQLAGMAQFLRNNKWHVFLQQQNWAEFACHYNGPGFEKHHYDTKLAQAHDRLSRNGLPDLRLRAVQLLLTYHGAEPGPVDGQWGARTEAALRGFRRQHGLPDSGSIDDALLAALHEMPASGSAPAAAGAVNVVLIQLLLAACGEFAGCGGWPPGAGDACGSRRFPLAGRACRRRRDRPGAAGQPAGCRAFPADRPPGDPAGTDAADAARLRPGRHGRPVGTADRGGPARRLSAGRERSGSRRARRAARRRCRPCRDTPP